MSQSVYLSWGYSSARTIENRQNCRAEIARCSWRQIRQRRAFEIVIECNWERTAAELGGKSVLLIIWKARLKTVYILYHDDEQQQQLSERMPEREMERVNFFHVEIFIATYENSSISLMPLIFCFCWIITDIHTQCTYLKNVSLYLCVRVCIYKKFYAWILTLGGFEGVSPDFNPSSCIYIYFFFTSMSITFRTAVER